MKTIQITLDEFLLRDVDQAVKNLKTTRSAFIRRSLLDEIALLRRSYMENKHRKGYTSHPVKPGEYTDWQDEQEWGEP